MKILVYYPATQKTQIIECERIEAGPGGIMWVNRRYSGFVGFCEDYTITIVDH